jgi:hypothetical protein
MYHLVCPAKYRRVVFDASVDAVLKEVCLEIAKRYALIFLPVIAYCQLFLCKNDFAKALPRTPGSMKTARRFSRWSVF